MAKRFFDTGMIEEDWFIEASIETKCLYQYAMSTCDHAGIFNTRKLKKFVFIYGLQPELSKFIEELAGRVLELENGSLLLTDFLKLQYKQLKANNRIHLSVIKALYDNKVNIRDIQRLLPIEKALIERFTLSKDLSQPYLTLSTDLHKGKETLSIDFNKSLQRVKDKDKEKDKDVEERVQGEETQDQEPQPQKANWHVEGKPVESIKAYLVNHYNAPLNAKRRDLPHQHFLESCLDKFETFAIGVDFHEPRHVFNSFNKFLMNELNRYEKDRSRNYPAKKQSATGAVAKNDYKYRSYNTLAFKSVSSARGLAR
ncbi:hypothetical protein AAG747_15310 [Rapidithrix thailandica]|uniref:Uncharacterized protein n=1 Tax=Rapidithrix thailandica TaxID=413964 RepID=A0AAW9SF05_9BACT